MTLSQIHDGLADAAGLFVAVLGLWALFLRIRSMPLDAGWYGTAVVGEILLVAQGVLGLILYLQGFGVMLPRPFMHILYGVVAVVTLPAAYSYFGGLEDDRVKSLAMFFVCFFLWGIIVRASSVAQFALPAP
jgi:hypothetical protein